MSKATRSLMRRRDFLKTTARASLAAASVGQFPFLLNCGRKESQHVGQRLVILGFDGVEPSLFERWASLGKLPHLRDLADGGSYTKLGSTNPPNSPVAWSTFATGMNPGEHNIFDLIKREPQSYLPNLATGRTEDPEFDANGKLTRPPRGVTYRDGQPFWIIAGESGIRAGVLNLPYAFPPDVIEGGRMLSALGTPDLRGTNSTFFYLATDLSQKEDGRSIAGGKLLKLPIGTPSGGLDRGASGRGWSQQRLFEDTPEVFSYSWLQGHPDSASETRAHRQGGRMEPLVWF